MSDFDKEAEREKLREKYERDQEKREATQRMSELLLKGATMTNRHCDACGDPIFRYDGQEFCPTCQNAAVNAEAAETAGDARSGDGAAADEGPGAAHGDAAAGSAPADGTGTPQSDDGSASTDGTVASAGSAPATSDADDAVDAGGTDASPTSGRAPPEEPARTGRTGAGKTSPHAGDRGDVGPRPAADRGAHDAPTAGGDDLDAARASLRRVVTRYSAAAEEANDPRRATELLAAAREAAETLAALRR